MLRATSERVFDWADEETREVRAGPDMDSCGLPYGGGHTQGCSAVTDGRPQLQRIVGRRANQGILGDETDGASIKKSKAKPHPYIP